MRYVILIAVVLAIGCTEVAAPEQTLEEFATAELPARAEKVLDLGNGWYSFELDICGKKRVFLFHREADYVGQSKYGLESVTEIQLDERNLK